MARLLAFIVLLIPGIIAVTGIKFMRDAIYGIIFNPFFNSTIQFTVGLLMCVVGVGFFAGFLLRRDQKNGRVQARFSKNDTQKAVKKNAP